MVLAAQILRREHFREWQLDIVHDPRVMATIHHAVTCMPANICKEMPVIFHESVLQRIACRPGTFSTGAGAYHAQHLAPQPILLSSPEPNA